MSATGKPTITESAISAAQALELIQSAVGYCREAGLQPKFVNKDGGLWLWLPGAELVTNAEGKAVVRLVAHEPEKDGEANGG